MARNAELIRQWEILRDIDAARTGVPIAKLAVLRHVHARTIRRDLHALSAAGFPLYDEKVNGTAMWKLRSRPFRDLEDTGLGTQELTALYFGRTLAECTFGAGIEDDVDRALAKLERTVPPALRAQLVDLRHAVRTKATGRKKLDPRRTRELMARALDASLARRRLAMTYDSASSQRIKDYLVEPLRVTGAHGGLYLTAWVPEYGESRTFAFERMRTLETIDERFEPHALPAEPFGNSLGVHSGRPEDIELEFTAAIADYVSGREWHRSQEFSRRTDGSLRLRLCVCNDLPLRSWILSFGSSVHVVAPHALATTILQDLDAARARYVPDVPAERLDRLPRRARQLRAS